jgi:AcrR family transcriptional regulator
MQKRSEETRERILAAAEKLFSQSGYDSTGVADICTKAGISKGAFYYSFKTKQAVFLNLLERWLAELDTQLNIIRERAKTVPEALLDMTAMIQFVFEAANDRLPMFLEFWVQASRDSDVWKATISPYRHYQDFFTSLVQEGISEGSLRPVVPKDTAIMIVSLAVGLLLQGLLDPDGTDWAQVTKKSMQNLIEGLGKRD